LPDARTDRPVRTRDGEVEWRCGACGAWNPLVGTGTCGTCGAGRRGFDAAPPTARPVTASRTAVVAATLVLPGLGHFLAGRVGTGIARALLALLWGVGGVALLTGGATAAGASLLAGWAVLLVSSLLDLPTAGAPSPPELLTARRLGLLVVAVTGLVLVAFVATATAGRG
jgi:TM2 domain-containing membrane protein YozV